MAVVGYQRVSSFDQSLERQELGVVDKLFAEKVSGKTAKGRPALQEMLGYIRDGDVVVVYSIDRLARDLRDLQDIISQVTEKGATIKFLTEGLSFSADADDPFAQLQLQMMGAFAQFERNIIRKRQAEGIAKAKERGVYKDRPRGPKHDYDKIRQLHAQGVNKAAIAREVGCTRITVHRVLKATA